MHIFFQPDIAETLQLSEEESNHAVKVLRLTSGDCINIVDGRGTMFEARIAVPHHKHTTVEITQTYPDFDKRPYYTHLAIAPTKNIDRLEWCVEKAVEIGVDEISLLICEHSERKVVKCDRIEKIIVSAMKQSKKATLTRLNPPLTYQEFMEKDFTRFDKYICHCYEGETRRLFAKECKAHSQTVIVVGPEGDFSMQEVNVARQKGFVPVSLGNERLRTETAGVAAVHTISIINQQV